MSFQLGNVENPNSPDNTCVFSIFEGPDSAVNLHVALDMYKEQLEMISSTTWRYMNMYIKERVVAWNIYAEINGLGYSSTVTMTSSQHFMDCLELQVHKNEMLKCLCTYINIH